MGERKAKWQNEYIARAYDRINLTIPKGDKEKLQAHAQAQGESVNGFIKRAIQETIERDSQAHQRPLDVSPGYSDTTSTDGSAGP